ncbi:MAG TPA: PaaI family thioesterase [Roseiflexaceae bacterium]|nr:PaaI family thioesterase [Roseiflexaceae bacterium]
MNEPFNPERTRTVSWSDPLIGARAAPEMSGLEFLQAISRGELPVPPIMALLNIGFVSAEAGRVVFSVEPAEYHYNPIGMIHGGLASTLCDSAMGCAIHSTLPSGVGYTTLELKVSFVRPLTMETGPVLCEGKVINVGGRVATAEARVTDRAGKLYAHATTTCLVMRPASGTEVLR